MLLKGIGRNKYLAEKNRLITKNSGPINNGFEYPIFYSKKIINTWIQEEIF